ARIQIFGKKAHGAYNWRGINAIEIAARVIQRLKEMKLPYKKHRLLQAPTVNIGTIKGGEKVNMVCDNCEFSLDLRFLPGMKHRDILKKVKLILKSECKKFNIVIDDIQQPYEIDQNHPYIKTYLKAARRCKCPASVKGSEGATVITFFQKQKIPAFATGFGAHGTAHTTDEYIYIDSLAKGTKMLEEYIKEYDLL
ncbi:MAG: M20/M25/M40 family metallo-hydrolase, partial [Candidatus Omnitrophica bacterium]|nr:M20/M25/M40 family metallo-hydrolase [Candidatus Omnitrophota bacterium]